MTGKLFLYSLKFVKKSLSGSFPLDKVSTLWFTKTIVLSPPTIARCAGGISYVSGTDTFYQIKPSTGQISHADTMYLDFVIPLLQKNEELLDERIVFQSVLHGITRGYPTCTSHRAAILCGTALVLAYARGILTHKDISYPEGGLGELKDELEGHKQEYVQSVARKLSDILSPKNLWEDRLSRVGVTFPARKKEIDDLAEGIKNLLSIWG